MNRRIVVSADARSMSGSVTRSFRLLFSVVLGIAVATPCHSQCGFEVDPAQSTRWHRNEGWPLPGLNDAKAIRAFRTPVGGREQPWPDGITVSLIEHDKDYQVRFPTMIFDENGSLKKLQQQNFYVEQLLRWRYRGKTYAYSYYLYPPNSACDSMIEIIDDRGDGRFRILIPTMLSIGSGNPEPPPVPEWLEKPKS
jgi:hypothetical protein